MVCLWQPYLYSDNLTNQNKKRIFAPMNLTLKNKLNPVIPFQMVNGVPVFADSTPCNNLYKPKGKNNPFGYGKKYSDWRKGQINRCIAAHVYGEVLDNGGGYGDLKRYIDPRCKYFNIDVSARMVFLDNSENRVVGDGESLPFKNESFDTVVSGDVLEHVESKQAYIRESFRVLKSGGTFVLNTPRTGWKQDYMRSCWFWIPLLSGLKSRIKYLFTGRPKVVEGTRDIPSDEKWLRAELDRIGFYVIEQRRTDRHIFSFTSFFWRWFADLFIDEAKYGHCVFFVCKKL